MPHAPGDRFGSYEVIELVGVGGMGEVYRARDTRLHRDIALKVLTDARRLDPESLQRFEREARLLASLNHPNIATLHGLETSGDRQALVMELVDGETLEDRLARSARTSGLPLAEALEIARQVAEALDAAHEGGVVHRDLKPANIKIRSDGTVKVLDFGIAKAFDTGTGGHRGTTVAATQLPGAIIGTPSYMSPEQARGGAVDRRTDIWSFGCVLYEMLTGQRPFDGDTASGIIARVLERDPDWSKLRPDLPPGVRVLLQRCLTKDPRRRRRDSGDVRLDLEQAIAEPRGDATPAAASAKRLRLWMSAAAVLALVAAALLAALLNPRPPAASPEAVRLSVLAPENAHFVTSLVAGSGAPVGGSISPNGRLLAFTARAGSGAITLWVRSLDSLDARSLPGTDDAALPFWSPDGRSIGFFTAGKLKRIDVAGGAPVDLCDVVRGQGGTWSRDGVIVFSPNLRSGLLRVSATGGEPVPLRTPGDDQRAYRFPYFLPDGRHFLYYAEGADAKDSGVFVAALDGNDTRRLLAADSAAVYAPPDRLLFVRQGTLFAQRFDSAKLETSGDPVRLAQSVPFEGSAAAFSASDNGVLTYRAAPADSDEQQFAWFDRSGKLLEAVGTPGTYRGVDLSPNGTRIAAHNHQGTGGDIWVIEPRGTTTRITFDPTQDNSSPIWSPDGSRIAFGSLRNSKWGLYQTTANGDGEEQLLLESEVPKIPGSWSPDGQYLVYWLYASPTHPWLLPLTGGASEPVQLIKSRTYEIHTEVSPDSKWIAYMSGSSGRAEVYVRPFPSGEGTVQISTSGGLTPRWRQDGKELFYWTSYDHGMVMAVPIEVMGGALVPGAPQALFGVDLAIVPHSTAVQNFHTYDVTPDGQRFVIPVPVSTLRSDGASGAITVVLNWTTLLP